MPKKKFLSSIFSRSSKQQRQVQPDDQQLTTDAVPVPDENSNESTSNLPELANNSSPFTSADLQLAASSYSQQLVPSPSPSSQLSPISPVAPLHPTMMSQNNNVVAVHNTQAQNVYQFSHVNNLHIGSVFKIRTADPEPEKPVCPATPDPPKEERVKAYTRTVQAMLQSAEHVDEKYINEISKHLGEGWQDVMRQLKFSEGQIHQFKVDFIIDGGLKEVIYQILLDWMRNEENPTLGELTSILWHSGHHQTVYYLKKLYKAERNMNNQERPEKLVV